MNNILVLLVSIILLSGCTTKSDYMLLQTKKGLTQHNIVSKGTREYIIMPQDRLKISIYRNPEFANAHYNTDHQLGQDMQRTGVVVDTKGDIYLPLINRVHIVGLTQTEAGKLITRKYKRYLKVPTVYVEVLNKRIYVIGEVKHPGPIKLDREKTTVLEAIAFAGDLTDNAVRDNIIVLSRDMHNRPYLRKVDLTNFDNLSYNNMMLYPNDVVYVQPDSWKEFKISSDNFTAPFKTISEVASPFVTLHYLIH